MPPRAAVGGGSAVSPASLSAWPCSPGRRRERAGLGVRGCAARGHRRGRGLAANWTHTARLLGGAFRWWGIGRVAPADLHPHVEVELAAQAGGVAARAPGFRRGTRAGAVPARYLLPAERGAPPH